MKTYGLPDKQELISIVTDEDGNPRLDTLKPIDAGDDWTPPRIIPLVKLPEPEHDQATQVCEPALSWYDDRVERGWTIRDLTPEEIAAKTRKVWKNAGLFWNEFTPTEQLAIMDSTQPEIRLLDRALVVWAGEVWSDDVRVQNGLDALVFNGIISAERKAEILS